MPDLETAPTRVRPRLQGSLALVAATVVLAACQAPQQGGVSPSAMLLSTPPAPVQQTAFGPSTLQRSTTLSSSSRSWVDESGTRHTRSSRTTASVSVDPSQMGNAVAMLLGATMGQPVPAQRAVRAADLAGAWRMDVGGRQCDLRLNPVTGPTGTASTFGCLGTELQSVTSWSLRGDEVVLSGMFDKPLALLGVTGPRRMDGDTEAAVPLVVWR